MKQITHAEAQQIPGTDIPGLIQEGIEIVDAVAPVIKTLFGKLAEWLSMIGKNNPDSPKNLRLRVKILETQNLLQKEKEKLRDSQDAVRDAYFQKLIDAGTLVP